MGSAPHARACERLANDGAVTSASFIEDRTNPQEGTSHEFFSPSFCRPKKALGRCIPWPRRSRPPACARFRIQRWQRLFLSDDANCGGRGYEWNHVRCGALLQQPVAPTRHCTTALSGIREREVPLFVGSGGQALLA